MAPKKRNLGVKAEHKEDVVKSTKVIKSAKVKADHSSVGKQISSPAALVCVFLVISTISAGVYVYSFVDTETLLDQLLDQISILRGTKEIPVGETKPEVNTDNKRDTKQETKAETQSTKEEVKKKSKATKTSSETESRSKDKQKPSTSDKAKSSYAKSDITNKDDNNIREDLDRADGLVEQQNPDDALKIFDKILKKYPKSPRATYGKAKALNVQAGLKRSNGILEQSITQYLKLLDLPDVPKALMLKNGKECVDRQQFRGWSSHAAKTIRRLLELYPDDLQLWRELGVQYLVTGKNEDARQAFKHIIRNNPNDGFAKVHLGFIIKTIDTNYEGAIPYLQEGIATGDEGVVDGRFFFHLGDALYRIGKHDEAYSVYESGAQKGLFMSKWQRSLYNADSLTGRPWWTLEQTGHATKLKNLEKHWKTIRDEGLAQLDPKTGSFVPEEENLREKGDWKQFTLFQKGRKVQANCKKVPKTCALIEEIPDAAGCKRGQVKFSVMHPGVHVWPHCGPTNCRVRAHLGLVVPDGPRIRVAEDERTWKEGKFIVFDDSFEHEVWHDGNSTRLVLIVDLWHPELTNRQKQQLTPI